MRIFKTSDKDEEDSFLSDIVEDSLYNYEDYWMLVPWAEHSKIKIEQSIDKKMCKASGKPESLERFKDSLLHPSGGTPLPPPQSPIKETDRYLIYNWDSGFARAMTFWSLLWSDTLSFWFRGPLNEWKYFVKGTPVKLVKNVHEKITGGDQNAEIFRNILKKNQGKIGYVERTFPNSDHINVQFPNDLLGIERRFIEHA